MTNAERPDGTRDSREAIAYFEEATRLAPHNGEAWLALGYAHYFADHHRDALTAFTRARLLIETGEAEVMAALCLAALGEGETASGWLLHALRAKNVELDVLQTIRGHERLRALLEANPTLRDAHEAAMDRALEGFGKGNHDWRKPRG